MADQGTGISITFDSGYFATITGGTLNMSRGEVDVTTFATTGGMAYEPADLTDSTLDVEYLFAPGTTPNIKNGASEACTVTFSDSGAATWAWTGGFMTNMQVAMTIGDRTRGTGTLRLSGTPTITP